MRVTVWHLLILSLALLMTGCVWREKPEYPEYWPAVAATSADCPDLTGLFDNQDLNEEQPVLLAKWLLVTADPLKKVHRVRLAGPEQGTLSVYFLNPAGEVIFTRELHAGADFACKAGWLERRQPEVTFLGVIQRHKSMMVRTTEGDLVVEDLDTGGGVVIVVPAFASFRIWHLYRSRPH